MSNFLVDTNIFLEVLLDQARSEDCKKFLIEMDSKRMKISRFSLYSIAYILNKKNKFELFHKFFSDISEHIEILILDNQDLLGIFEVMQSTKLDFDDAYQAVLVAKYQLTLVSLDADFDKAKIQRIDPKDITL